ncbi:NAD(P)-dependent oxidoreductase [Asaia sp. As-1742]|uniref:NAD-dependent epimerase/dehydratase family protein n=1 Tax=Asaia sp. As-1742 TaxID=2608325 RepID=UPI00141EC88C|nr:NAD(P)-dependent oxidoreductase [Asaia sp. As-1742]NIE81104.1 NAD(P)-dependent oxidoreductase [Asaia sp. As-1742]
MDKTLFLAGATGTIGSRLVPLLLAEKWRVVGTTRSTEKATRLRERGVEPVVVDVFESAALIDAVAATKPEIVVHQLTDLPPRLDPARMVEATARNARIRDEGTRNLVEAAIRAGVRHFIAQSVAFAYAEGPTPHTEEDALAIEAEGRAGISARGVASLETQVLSAPFVGAVLRYGRLYGPGTGFETPAGLAPLHVDSAANAALLALLHGARGIYNFAEDDGAVSSEKAKRELNWSADWR